jgi:hypothetical protein
MTRTMMAVVTERKRHVTMARRGVDVKIDVDDAI